MELSPRTSEEMKPSRAVGSRRVMAGGVLVVVLIALGVIVYQGLSDATVYFRNVDEAVAQRDELGTSRFRLQGTVLGEPTETAGGADFDVTFNGEVMHVQHQGDPPRMFAPGRAVVLEGHWAETGDYYASDTMFIAHDNEYQAEDEYDERMNEADEGAEGAGAAG